MRICHVGNIASESANGVIEATSALVENLSTVGVDCEVWNFSRSVREPTHRLVRGVSRWQLPVRGPRGSVGSHAQIPTIETVRWLRDRRRLFDVLHLHSVFQIDHVWTSHLGVPFVLTPHGGLAPFFLQKKHLRKRVWRCLHEDSLIERAASVQALTSSEERQIRNVAKQAFPAVLPMPLSRALFERPEVRYAGDGPLLNLGRLNYYEKGLDRLLSVLALLDRRLLKRGIIFAGPGRRDDLRLLRNRVKELRLSEYVSILGPVHGELKHRLIESASVVIQFSRSEGLPLVPLEAITLGVPVIVSPECNLDDVVSTSGCGWVIDTERSNAATQISEILNLPELALAETGHQGRAWSNLNLSWPALWPQYLSMYRAAKNIDV